jgi:hypothetical protein
MVKSSRRAKAIVWYLMSEVRIEVLLGKSELGRLLRHRYDTWRPYIQIQRTY